MAISILNKYKLIIWIREKQTFLSKPKILLLWAKDPLKAQGRLHTVCFLSWCRLE